MISWDKVWDVVEDGNTGFDFHEYDNYVMFDCPDSPYFVEIEKNKIENKDALIAYLKDCYDDFDIDEFCKNWLNAKWNGVKDVPGIRQLVDVADYIVECLENLLILLAKPESVME